jgi:hypothetical protein
MMHTVLQITAAIVNVAVHTSAPMEPLQYPSEHITLTATITVITIIVLVDRRQQLHALIHILRADCSHTSSANL